MFIDISTYVGHWPFRRLCNNTLKSLDKLAQNNGITHMVVANINGFFYKNAHEANLELMEWLSDYKGKTVFLPLAIVNPTYPGWERNARKMIESGFCGFELCPLYHEFSFAPEMLYDETANVHRAGQVMALAEELNVPVRVCADFENVRGRSYLDTLDSICGDDIFNLVKNYKKVNVLVTCLNPLSVGDKLKNIIKERNNIFFDLTQIETLSDALCERVLNEVNEDLICFGSLSPFNYMETNLLRIELAEKICAEKVKENGARAFNLI